jgi:predicted nucleic acid-binding protein
MPEVIADTSPIQYLYQIALLDVLNVLYGRIIIPEAVAAELNVGREGGISLPDVSSIDWMTVKRPLGHAILPIVPDLGPGEREAIALAIETTDSLLILDDALARRHAQLLRIKMTGTLGVLLKAKQTGHLKAVEPAMDRLEALGFFLDASTRSAVLKLAQEYEN